MALQIDRRTALAALGSFAMLPAWALKAYGPGVSDTEIRIGQTMPYSGPIAINSVQGKVQFAYFKALNEQGGINGRKITLLSVDDGYVPAKTVEQTRKMVETENVAFIFSSLGAAPNVAIRKFLNDKKVPQLLCATGNDALSDPQNFPWTTPYAPSFADEGRIFGRYIRQAHPKAKIAVLFQNDDVGKYAVRGLREGLGDAASSIVSEASFQVADPSVDSQVISLLGADPTVFVTAGTQKVAGQATRKIYELKKKLTHVVSYGAASGAIAQKPPPGLEGLQEFIAGTFLKDPTDPQMANDAAVKEYVELVKKHYPDGNPNEFLVVFGYACAQMLEGVLRKCGDNLTRENILKQATSLDATVPMLAPGIRVKNSSANFFSIRQMRLQRYDGTRWVPFGAVVDAA